jgi:hypothetical protein
MTRISVRESVDGNRRAREINTDDNSSSNGRTTMGTIEEDFIREGEAKQAELEKQFGVFVTDAGDGEQHSGRAAWLERETALSRQPNGNAVRVDDADPDEDDVAGSATSGMTARDSWIAREFERSRTVPTATTYERDNSNLADLVQDIS